jgi:hypothetical protein
MRSEVGEEIGAGLIFGLPMSYIDVGHAAMPFSLRLDADTDARIRRLAAATGRSRSAVVREAVARYAAQGDAANEEPSAFQRLSPFVGIVRTGGADYSVETHAKYRARLGRKRRARRPR